MKINDRIGRLEDLHCLRTEIELRKAQLDACRMDRLREEMRGQCAGLDSELLQRLLDAGFSSRAILAITLARLAITAWASGSVSEQEWDQAMLAIFDSPISGNADAIEMYRDWLRNRPPEHLLDLWSDYTQATRHRHDQGQWRTEGEHLVQQANRVAIASGGLLGFGKLCAAEQLILDRIDSVYSLTE